LFKLKKKKEKRNKRKKEKRNKRKKEIDGIPLRQCVA